jgi:hypothetical protein
MNSTEGALRELGLIAQGANPQQSPVMEEFQTCPEWQLASALLSRALAHEHPRFRPDAVVAAPAQWLPPLL